MKVSWQPADIERWLHSDNKGKTRYEHKCHFLENNVEGVREFGWVVPVRGLLHMETNVARSFMKLNWSFFMKSLALQLGLQSPKALEYIEKGSDHTNFGILWRYPIPLFVWSLLFCM